MIVEKHSLFMLCAAALMVAGCQTDDIYALSGSCPDLESITENGIEICTRANPTECIKNHDTSDALRAVDFEAAFKTNRCPKGYECRAQKHQCEPCR